jgi:hypothetical protein
MPPEARPTIVVDGLAFANELRDALALEVAALVAAGRRSPCLAVVLVGDDPASASYIKGKRRACERVGMTSVERALPATLSQAALIQQIEALNRDGHYWISATHVRGKSVLRMMIISYLSTAEHLAGLQQALQSAAQRLLVHAAV